MGNDPGQFTGTENGGTGGTANLNNPKVWMGNFAPTVIAGQDRNDRQSGQIKANTEASIDEAVARFNDPKYFSPQDIADLGRTLAKAGIISNAGDYDQIQQQWAKAVQDAAMAYSVGGQKITPMQMLANKIAFRSTAANGAGTKTDTSTSYSIPSPQDAEAVVKGVFQQGLGRDPTAHELAKYSTMIAGIAESSPSTSTTTSSSDGTNVKSRTTTTNRGVSSAGQAQAVMDKIQGDPEYGAYQSATTYFNAMLKAIASPV